jgi:hypothetical protein
MSSSGPALLPQPRDETREGGFLAPPGMDAEEVEPVRGMKRK